MELQAQSSEEGSQALTLDQICDTVLGTRFGYVCGLGHGPKPIGSSSRNRALESSNRELREELAT
ncbi:putative Transposase, Ptta/En/Spm, plant [Cocos nucifera]|uniref:Putative Transposase, Ptta/En/Spm, plant n=1 Tax=Cocos nucifera TaxID=13894 RepID=A0A8K0MYN1_COCNU|nr:putative Transposase, Ptta/En/Spm, plant [Cocos nucifera]